MLSHQIMTLQSGKQVLWALCQKAEISILQKITYHIRPCDILILTTIPPAQWVSGISNSAQSRGKDEEYPSVGSIFLHRPDDIEQVRWTKMHEKLIQPVIFQIIM